MSIVVGTLTIDLTANTASFSQSMDKMSQLSAKTANDVKRSLEKIAAAGIAMGAALATGVTALIVHSLDAVDTMAKLAQSVGTTTETLSVLQYAASLSGASAEEMGKGLEKLAKSAFSAVNGNQLLANVFERLGVSTVDANGHLDDSGIIFGKVATKFAAMQDGAGKTALAMTLFGKAGAGLIPTLNAFGENQAKVTEEARQFGVVVGTSTAQIASDAHDNLDRLKAVAQGLGYSLLSATLPALNKLTEQLIQIAKEANIPQLAKTFGESVSTAVTKIGNGLQFLVTHIQEVKIALEALAALQILRIGIPLLAQLSSASLTAGVGKFVVGLLGIGKVVPILIEFAGWVKYTTSFLTLMIAEEGIAATASYALSGALAFLGGPIGIAVIALTGLAGAMYAFRTKTFEARGEVYEFVDAYRALFELLKKAGNLSFFGRDLNGSASDQFGAALKQMKADREAAEAAGKKTAEAITPKAAKKPAFGVSGLGAVVKDTYKELIDKLDLAIAKQQAYLDVLGGTPEQIQAVASAERAESIILEENNKLKAERKKLSANQEAAIRERVVLADQLQALNEYGKGLVDQERSTALFTAQTLTLANAIQYGDEAVRKTTISNEILGLTYGKTADQVRALAPEIQKLQESLNESSNAHIVLSANQDTENIKREIESRKGLSTALLQGEDAYRLASLNTKLYVLDQQIAVTADDAARKALLAKRQAIIDLTIAEEHEQDARDAIQLRSPLATYNEELAALQRQVVALTANGKAALSRAEAIGVAAKTQDAFNKATESTIDLLLREGTAGDGVTAFFLKMQEQAKTTGAIIYDALNSAFDKVSDNLAELISGGKADFGQMFKDLSKQIAKDTIQSTLQKGLGALGNSLGIGLPSALVGKADGSSSNPYHVVVAGGQLAAGSKAIDTLAPKLENIFGKLGKDLTGLFSSIGSTLGSVFKSIGGGISGVFGFLSHLIPHADGGSVNPSSAYLVGERGPEILSGASGRIYSNAESGRMISGNGGGNFYNINAGGANPADVEMRVQRAIAAERGGAVRNALVVQQELRARSPRSKFF